LNQTRVPVAGSRPQRESTATACRRGHGSTCKAAGRRGRADENVSQGCSAPDASRAGEGVPGGTGLEGGSRSAVAVSLPPLARVHLAVGHTAARRESSR
jgi:hypothetical protein